jgi:hypothetical protein
MPGFKCVKTVDTLIELFLALNENEPILIKHLILEFGQYLQVFFQFLIIYLGGRSISTYLPMSEALYHQEVGLSPIDKQAGFKVTGEGLIDQESCILRECFLFCGNDFPDVSQSDVVVKPKRKMN